MNLIDKFLATKDPDDKLKILKNCSRDELRRSRTANGDTLLTLICKTFKHSVDGKYIKIIIDIDPVMAGIPDQQGKTPLMCFVTYGDDEYDIIKLLLSTNHAYPNAQDIDGNTALMHSTSYFFYRGIDSDLLILKTGKANLKAQNNLGNTALIYACKPRYEKLVIKMLEQGDCNIGAQGEDGITALLKCCYNELYTLANKLLETNEARPELQDSIGNTALIIACRDGNYDFVKKLLRYNSNPGAVNNNGNTALITALMAGHENIAMTILKAYHDNVLHKNNAGKTAYDYAIQRDFKKIAKFLDPALYTLYALKSTVGDELRDTETISNIVESINENKYGGKKRKQKTRRNKGRGGHKN